MAKVLTSWWCSADIDKVVLSLAHLRACPDVDTVGPVGLQTRQTPSQLVRITDTILGLDDTQIQTTHWKQK